MRLIVFAVVCLVAVSHAQNESPKVWGEMDVRDAGVFTPAQFKRDYVLKNHAQEPTRDNPRFDTSRMLVETS